MSAAPVPPTRGTLAVIVVFGVMAVAALVFAGLLALDDKPQALVILFVGLSTTVAGWLAPSPLAHAGPPAPATEIHVHAAPSADK